ncbi:hypothetical protein ACFL2C_02190 [Patescibacteria group bacterium]
MRLIGLLISISILLFVFVWWTSKSINRYSETTETIQILEESDGTNSQSTTNPVDYSEQKVEEINEATLNRGNNLDQLP